VSLTTWDNLWQWGSIDDGGLPKYLFSSRKPASIDGVEWRLVREIRKEIGDDSYDKKVRRLFTLIVDDPVTRYTDINNVWNKFMEIFMVFGSIVTYTGVWKDYFRQSLQEHYDDNVQYLEFRGVLPEVDMSRREQSESLSRFIAEIYFADIRPGGQDLWADRGVPDVRGCAARVPTKPSQFRRIEVYLCAN
jgi:hypothetical protein